MTKKILYIDMDGVLVDFDSAIAKLSDHDKQVFKGNYDRVANIFGMMEPMPNALRSYAMLSQKFDTYILSTGSWNNATAWSDKLLWVKKYLPEAHKRLILSHNKHLNMGDFLIDDRLLNGADRFTGEHIHFGSEKFPGWSEINVYLMSEVK